MQHVKVVGWVGFSARVDGRGSLAAYKSSHATRAPWGKGLRGETLVVARYKSGLGKGAPGRNVGRCTLQERPWGKGLRGETLVVARYKSGLGKGAPGRNVGRCTLQERPWEGG